MRLLADECLHSDIVRDLRADGHDVVYAAESLRQSSDVDLAGLALRDGRILITEDKGFGEIAFQRLQAVPGIVLLRISARHRALKSPNLTKVIEQYGPTLHDNLTVVEEAAVRQRSLRLGG